MTFCIPLPISDSALNTESLSSYVLSVKWARYLAPSAPHGPIYPPATPKLGQAQDQRIHAPCLPGPGEVQIFEGQ
jgi:hypothetical protein